MNSENQLLTEREDALTRYDRMLQQITRPYKAFLYDCDGTLADNMQAHKDAYVQTAAGYGLTLDPALIDELAGWPTLAVVGEINRRFGTKIEPAAFGRQKSELFIREFIDHTLPIEHVVRHLRTQAGKAKIAVVTGGSRNTVTKTLTVLGIFQFIDLMVCAGDTPHGKPYPDPFLRAADLLQVAPEDCLVFEDGEPGVAAAIAAGMDCIRIDRV